MVPKYRDTIYKYLRRRNDLYLFNYRRVYLVGNDDMKRVFVELQPISNLPSEQAKQQIIQCMGYKFEEGSVNIFV